MIDYKQIHVVSFDVPFPPIYGGIIDVYAKLKAFKKAGFYLILHCYKYNNTNSDSPSDTIYDEIFYYKRNIGIQSQLSKLPYIVKSRINAELVKNISQKKGILFLEGLHCSWLLSEPMLSDRFKIVRLHNIEHNYYNSLANSTSNVIKKVYYTIEAIKLKKYESVIEKANIICPISENDTYYFAEKYPEIPNLFLSAFHLNDEIDITDGLGKYALYQANLAVSENEKVVLELIRKWGNNSFKLIIAGNKPTDKIYRAIQNSTIELIANPDRNSLISLIKNAQLNIIWANSASGSKLRLADALYYGKHILISKNLSNANYFNSFSDADELINWVEKLQNMVFTKADIDNRVKFVNDLENNTELVNKLVNKLKEF